MAQPIADKSVEKDVSPARVFEAGVALGQASERARIRRETATAILAGSAAASRGGGLDAVTDSAIEWADMLLEKLSRG